MRYQAVLWDFDGTLVDTSEGIFRSLRVALAEMDIPEPPPQVLRNFIGPPLLDSLARYCEVEGQRAVDTVMAYRRDYEAKGIFQAKVYAGLEQLLKQLREKGIKIGVATLKPEHMAKRLLEHFEIADLVDTCRGTPGDTTAGPTKAQVMTLAMADLKTEIADAVMIGDTVFDAQGAQELGMDFVAAAYGFGKEDMYALPSVFTAHNAADLARFFFEPSV